MAELSLWLIALVLGVIITIIATEPINYLMARFLGTWIHRPPRGVKGIWDTTYQYKKGGKKKTEHELIELKQFGNYIVGRVLIGQAHSVTFQGRIRHEIYFTGAWETDVPGQIYHGAFQFSLDVQGRKMLGRWIGLNSQHQIDTGEWEWNLISDHVGPATRQKAIADFKRKIDELNSIPDNLPKAPSK